MAGYAEYAFNEYLQFCLEGGIVLLLLILSFGISVLNEGLPVNSMAFVERCFR